MIDLRSCDIRYIILIKVCSIWYGHTHIDATGFLTQLAGVIWSGQILINQREECTHICACVVSTPHEWVGGGGGCLGSEGIGCQLWEICHGCCVPSSTSGAHWQDAGESISPDNQVDLPILNPLLSLRGSPLSNYTLFSHSVPLEPWFSVTLILFWPAERGFRDCDRYADYHVL